MMKLHFEDNLDYQLAAIKSTVDLFRGQEINQTEFSVLAPAPRIKHQPHLPGMEESTLGIGNRLQLLDDEILENLQKIQLRNGLKPVESVVSGDFTVEMETGTGKTYVYLRTIFELNKHYGFTKFMISIPSSALSVAISFILLQSWSITSINSTLSGLSSTYKTVPLLLLSTSSSCVIWR